jgi:hypothetical protein
VSAFTIQCTTCRRSLRVTNPEAIGQILSCPKCGSMVLVEAPAGWTQTAASADGPALKSADLTRAGKPVVAVSESVGVAANEATSAALVQTVAAVQVTPAAPQVSAAKTVASKPLSKPAVRPAVLKPAADTAAPQLAKSRSSGVLKAEHQGPPVAAERSPAWKHPPKESAPIVAEVATEIPPPVPAESPVPAAGAHPWPKWFWPGVAVVLAASGLILTVRMLTRSGDDSRTAAIATDAQRATGSQPTETGTTSVDASAGAAKQTEPSAIEPVADRTASDASKESKSADVGAIVKGNATDVDSVQAPATSDTPPASTAANVQVPPPPNSVPPPPAQPAVAPMESIAVATSPTVPAKSSETADPPHPGPQRTLQRVPPRVVNVAARMATPVRGFEVRGQGLVDFLALVSDLSSIPITLDADAMLDFGQSPAAPVTVKLTDTTVADVLDGALEPLRLGYQAPDGQLIVGYSHQENPRQVRYAVGDLAADDAALGQLAALVRRMIAPKSWQQAGGKGSIVAGNGTLVVNQTEPALAQTLVFCEKLRVARGLPIKSRLDPARFVLNTREDKAHEMLNRPVTANFSTPQPLSGAIKWLHDSTGATILVNHAALAEQAMSDESECAGAVAKKALATLLDDLTGSAELAWRAIDEKTIEITTRQDAGKKMDVEFYAVGSIAGDSGAGEKLATELKSKIEPQLWGDASDKAAIYFDAPSRVLIVRAPQRTQAQVEVFLGSRSSAK